MAATDVIIPPPEIKAIVDKTADFVAKHGPALEQKILGREAGVKKFEFLLATSVYHAYYRAKVTECSGGASAAAPAPTVAEVAQENVARRASATAGMISKAADVKEVAPKRPLVEPPKNAFIADYPDGIIINGCDMDVIKMTAQFVARNGKAFLSQLSTREARNPQFQFLRSDHLLFSFFTSLVEQYAHVCHPSPALLEALQKNIDAPAQLLERALQKLDWTLHLEAEAAARAAQDEAEAQASAAIDWHDFSIVETLVFEDAELRGLSHPMSQPELLAFVKATQASAVTAVPQQQQQQQQQQQGGGGDGDEDMDMDMETDDKPTVAPSAAPAAPATILPSYSRPTAASTASSAQYKIVGVQLPQGPQHARPEDIGEHIRVELLDPKWREEKKNFAARQAGDNYAEVTNVGQNLDQMARRRRDIFGDEEEDGVGSSGPGHKEALQKAVQAGLYRVGQPVPKPAGKDDSDDDDNAPAAKQRPAPTPAAAKPAPAPAPAVQAPTPQSIAAAASRPPVMPSLASAPRPPGAPVPVTSAAAPPAMPPAQPNMPGMPPMPMHPGMMGMPPGAPLVNMRGEIISSGVMPGMHGFPPQPGMHGMMMNAPHGMMMQHGGPQQQMGQPAAGDELGKRGREAGELVPADEFLRQFPGDVTVRVRCPAEPELVQWALQGQTLSHTMAPTMTIQDVKVFIQGATQLPANKQKLSLEGQGVLKDSLTLAFYNVSSGTEFSLQLKTRGGK